MALQPQFGPWPAWEGYQLVARPLPVHKHRKSRACTHMQTPNIHVLSGVRTYDPDFRGSEDTACLRQLGYRDRPILILPYYHKYKNCFCQTKIESK
jgi:hypothetical protein